MGAHQETPSQGAGSTQGGTTFLSRRCISSPFSDIITVMASNARRRAFWISDELWLTASAVAKQRGESLAEVLRESLRRYIRRNQ